MHDCVCRPGGAGGTPSQDVTHYCTHVSLEVGCAESNVSPLSVESGLRRHTQACVVSVTHTRGSREIGDPPECTSAIARNGGLSRMIA